MPAAKDGVFSLTGKVLQVNVSKGGVPKLPIERGTVSRLGIAGDKHLYRLHGGPRKALLLMAAEVIDTLAEEGFLVFYGALGENLTLRGLPHQEWCAGQRFQVGSALVELTEARVPCRKLEPYGHGIQKRIFDARSGRLPGESGYYAAVIKDGTVEAGDTIQMVDPVVTPCPPLQP